MSTVIHCARCGVELTTQEALHGEALQTPEGLVHENCGDEFEVAERERRREEGDVPLSPEESARLFEAKS